MGWPPQAIVLHVGTRRFASVTRNCRSNGCPTKTLRSLCKTNPSLARRRPPRFRKMAELLAAYSAANSVSSVVDRKHSSNTTNSQRQVRCVALAQNETRARSRNELTAKSAASQGELGLSGGSHHVRYKKSEQLFESACSAVIPSDFVRCNCKWSISQNNLAQAISPIRDDLDSAMALVRESDCESKAFGHR